MASWILVPIAIAALVTAMVRFNRATCRKAFAEGCLSYNKPNAEVSETFKSYLSPMRPMDAAAFLKGLEYAASMPNLNVDSAKFGNEFKRIYKTGVLTAEGTRIRHMGKDTVAQMFQNNLEQLARRSRFS